MNKRFWTSKTLWVMGIAFAAAIAQEITGKEVIDPQLQLAIITGVGVVLRMVTKNSLDWAL